MIYFLSNLYCIYNRSENPQLVSIKYCIVQSSIVFQLTFQISTKEPTFQSTVDDTNMSTVKALLLAFNYTSCWSQHKLWNMSRLMKLLELCKSDWRNCYTRACAASVIHWAPPWNQLLLNTVVWLPLFVGHYNNHCSFWREHVSFSRGYCPARILVLLLANYYGAVVPLSPIL